MRSGAADLLSAPGKPVSSLLKNTFSTSAPSQVCKRLPWEGLSRFVTKQALAISDLATGWEEREVALDVALPLGARLGRGEAVRPG